MSALGGWLRRWGLVALATFFLLQAAVGTCGKDCHYNAALKKTACADGARR